MKICLFGIRRWQSYVAVVAGAAALTGLVSNIRRSLLQPAVPELVSVHPIDLPDTPRSTRTITTKTDNLPSRPHPHTGARGPDGQYGYVADVSAIPRKWKRQGRNMSSENDIICDGKRTQSWIREQQKRERDTFEYFQTKLTVQARDSKHQAKLLCLVYTHGSSSARASLRAIRDTWGRRCDGFLAASTETDESMGAVDLPHEGVEHYDNLWQKARSALAYAADNYLNQYDCFHVTGDDTLVIVENLRKLCHERVVEQKGPFYAGSWNPWKGDDGTLEVFAGGGAGYTFNQAALKALVDHLPDCHPDVHKMDDVHVGKCLRQLNVTVSDTRDESGEPLYLDGGFAKFRPLDDLEHRSKLPWRQSVFKWKRYELGWDIGLGKDCASKYAVSFHRFEGDDLRRYHALTYKSCSAGTALGDATRVVYGGNSSISDK